MTKTCRNDIQGLRAIAVLAVIIFHINKKWLPGGFIGVDLFFVISGYVVSSIILYKKEKSKFVLLNFYLQRLKRICPAYFVMLSVVTILMAVLLIPTDFSFYMDSLKSALYFNSNQYFASFGDYFAPGAPELPLLHTWSLAIEMQFYLLLPLLIYWIPVKYLKILTLSSIVFLLLWLLNENHKQEIYFSVYYRIPEFFFGLLMSLSSKNIAFSQQNQNRTTWFGGVLILIALLTINDTQNYPNLIILIPCFGVSLVLLSRAGRLNRYLSNNILIYIGNRSYSLYLWHWPVLAVIRYYIGRYDLALSELSVFVFFTLILSNFSYRYIEGPFRTKLNLKEILNRTCISTVFVIASIMLAPLLNKSLVVPLPIELTRYADGKKICHGQIVGNCYRGALQGKSEILVLGDSHAAQLNYFFDEVGKINDFRAKLITSSSCITIPEFDVERLPNFARSTCVSQIKIAKKNIETANKILLAGMWEYHINSRAFIKALEHFLSKADINGKKIIILGQIPMFDSNISRIYRFGKIGFPARIILNNEWKVANAIIDRIASEHTSAKFIDLSRTQFFSKAPYYEGILIYFDKDHLNETGSHQYGRAVASIFQKEVGSIISASS